MLTQLPAPLHPHMLIHLPQFPHRTILSAQLRMLIQPGVPELLRQGLCWEGTLIPMQTPARSSCTRGDFGAQPREIQELQLNFAQHPWLQIPSGAGVHESQKGENSFPCPWKAQGKTERRREQADIYL